MTETRILGFIVNREEIRMEPDRMKTILEWPEPKTLT